MSNRIPTKTDHIYFTAIIKGNERFIFLYDDESAAALERRLWQFASRPELSFSEVDAAELSIEVQERDK